MHVLSIFVPGIIVCRRWPVRDIVAMEAQRAFAVRYRNGDVDWIPPSEALDCYILWDHTLVWHPPMLPPLVEKWYRVRDELARWAEHPLAAAIQHRGVRALWVVEQQHAAAGRPHGSCLPGAPCVWRGRFAITMCPGVPPAPRSRGWLCEFRICDLCQTLYERCSFCCRWTGLPVRPTAETIEICQMSQVALGDLAREYAETWRVPFENMPGHLRLELTRYQIFDSAQERCASWFKMMVRRALCEDPPSGILPPRLSHLLESQSDPEEDFFYVPRGHRIFQASVR